MILNIQHHDQYVHIQFTEGNSFNNSNTDDIKKDIFAAYQPGKTIILDFYNLESIDSTGLTALIYIRKKITDTNGRLIIVNIRDRIKKLFQITRLHRIFEMHNSIGTALQLIRHKKEAPNETNPYAIHLDVQQADRYNLVTIQQPNSLIKVNCQEFKEKIAKYIQHNNSHIILNFDAIRNIDSSGIAALIHIKRIAKQENKKIFLVYDNRVLNRLFNLYSLNDLFPQFQNNEEAIFAVGPVVNKNKELDIEKKKTDTNKDESLSFAVHHTDIEFLKSWNE